MRAARAYPTPRPCRASEFAYAALVIVVWLRRDLRLADNPALADAAGRGVVVPVFVLDPRLLGRSERRDAWMAATLAALDHDLRARGARLIVRRGDAVAELVRVARELPDHVGTLPLPPLPLGLPPAGEPAAQRALSARRADASTRTLTACGAGCPSSVRPDRSTSTRPGKPEMSRVIRRPSSSWPPRGGEPSLRSAARRPRDCHERRRRRAQRRSPTAPHANRPS
jgi:hypothetical protein